MAEMLKKLGIRAMFVSNGQEAFEMAKHHKFHLILMDIMMPVMDGIESTRLIRSEGLNKDTKIIAVTTMALGKSDFQSGLSDYLSKPFTNADLKQVIKRNIVID
jgi:CheY-like chemotaxis protein